MTVADGLFVLCALSAVVAAGVVVTARHAIHAAFALVLMFFPVAGLFVLLSAGFVAVVQVLVYAGAILVLFTFVIMMINQKQEETIDAKPPAFRALALLPVGLLLVAAGLAVTSFTKPPARVSQSAGGGVPMVSSAQQRNALPDDEYGGPKAIGDVMFDAKNGFVYQFEVVSLLVLAAVIGAVILAKRRL